MAASFTQDSRQPEVSQNDTAQVESLASKAAAGRQLFQENGCFVCHGKAGAGGRAPALAPLVSKLTDPELSHLLQEPNAKMQAGGMPSVSASSEEIASLIVYLRSLPLPQAAAQPAQNQVRIAEMSPATRIADPAPAVAIEQAVSQVKEPSNLGKWAFFRANS